MTRPHQKTQLAPLDTFARRHIGPREAETRAMLDAVGFETIEALIEATIPPPIRLDRALSVPEARGESAMIEEARALAAENRPARNFIGRGYYGTRTPAVIARNVLENPSWYTQYTPYQPEIAQGRLEALLNFQTVVADLCGLPIANASLLDEPTAAAEAIAMCFGAARSKRRRVLVDQSCHEQTIAVVRTRAEPVGIEIEVGDPASFTFGDEVAAALIAYPDTYGAVRADLAQIAERAHDAGAFLIVSADPLALCVLESPGAQGADIVVGSAQRFGVPMGFGGPHAAFMAASDKFTRKLPGRLVGVSQDADGRSALRLALQTREQHIRRDKATSNICTSQVLLAVIAGFYAVYHGPEGLGAIAQRVHAMASALGAALRERGVAIEAGARFGTVRARPEEVSAIGARLARAGIEAWEPGDDSIVIAFDETHDLRDLDALWGAFTDEAGAAPRWEAIARDLEPSWPESLRRRTPFLTHPTFYRYRSEHELTRYMHRLAGRDLSLTTSMIPLGSCTMKLNATAEMVPISFEGFAHLHPYTAPERASGYRRLIEELESMLAEVTGFAAVSLQPNAGSQGEYAGLLAIRAYHASRGEQERRVCLIPSSAHGTNPASAVMAGMKVVVVQCDEEGNIDLADLAGKAREHSGSLAALMITYPSTHGVFEEGVVRACRIVHEAGGQVYMDGANMNAQVGLCRPGDFGADVCHLNLHKTFCIPHGGGGPGVGPIGVASHLAPFLPGHPEGGEGGVVGPVSGARWGSAGILPISWMYMRMMGPDGLKRASEIAILNANYLAARLKEHYELLYTGPRGTIAHEFILDVRPITKSCGVTVADIAKRLMDYGFHAPTMSWPVAGTLMIEPTESESLEELDRFVDALAAIRREIAAVERGDLALEESALRRAPHTAEVVVGEDWDRPYTRREAAFPLDWVVARKFWPATGRVDEAWGDRNLACTCPPLSEYES